MNQQRKIELQVLALHRVLAERIRCGDGSVVAKARANLERWKDGFGGELPAAYRMWQQMLAQAPALWLHLLESDDEASSRWRSNSPFAGVISARERWRIMRDAA
jgi:hypothetical protein